MRETERGREREGNRERKGSGRRNGGETQAHGAGRQRKRGNKYSMETFTVVLIIPTNPSQSFTAISAPRDGETKAWEEAE